MKKPSNVLFFLILLLLKILIISCANGTPVRDNKLSTTENAAAFYMVEGKEWVLSEVEGAGKTISLDRKKLEAAGFGEAFTINFENSRVSGMGAPNRFSGQYTKGDNNSLNIGNMVSTRMAAFIEPEDLKEHEYFGYLSGVNRWSTQTGRLELHCVNSNGLEAVLVFTKL